ncbi:MAG: hypothetical protein AAF415_02280 [Pseudomonadota bacterium]
MEIEFNGHSYKLRPSFGAAREIEAMPNGLSIEELVVIHQRSIESRQERGGLSYEEVAGILFAGMRAAGVANASYGAVGDAVFEMRKTHPYIQHKVMEFLVALLWAPDHAKKLMAVMFPPQDHGGGESDPLT